MLKLERSGVSERRDSRGDSFAERLCAAEPDAYFAITAASVDGSIHHTVTAAFEIDTPTPYTLTPSQPVSISPGAAAVYSVAVADVNGQTQQVTLTPGGLPAGVSLNYQSSPSVTGNGTVSFQFNTDPAMASGTYAIAVAGTNGAAFGNYPLATSLTLTVNGTNPDFYVCPPNPTTVVPPGTAVSVPLSVTRINGFSNTIGMRITAVTPGLTVTGVPASGITNSATITVQADASLADPSLASLPYSIDCLPCPDDAAWPPGNSALPIGAARASCRPIRIPIVPIPQPAPVITQVDAPAVLYSGGAATIAIEGVHFGNTADDVGFCLAGADPCVMPAGVTSMSYSFISWSDTRIVLTVNLPAGAPVGLWELFVISAGWIAGQSAAHPSRSSVVVVNLPKLRTQVVGPPVAGDGDAVIATVPFTLQVEAYDPRTNQRLSQISGPVTVVWEQGPGAESLPSQVVLSGGVGTAGATINAVNETSQTRHYTVSTTYDTEVNAVNVRFQVIATDEGLVGSTTACGNQIQAQDYFAALPATGLCGTSVNLRASGQATVTTVQDVGPWFPNQNPTSGNPCRGGSDRYWNTTGVPRAAGDPCSSNGAGIDLADGTFSTLGLTGNATILWRFGR